MSVNKIVLAYSGGLDTSVILKWLAEEYECPIIAYAADVGQHEDWDAIREKGMATGAEKVIISDLREEYVRDYIFPAFRANAIYEGSYLLGTSLARPIIAKEQIRIAEQEGADAVSHGATGKGNDQVRFELGYLALNPTIQIIAPWRFWDLNSRKKLVAFAQEHNIPIPTTKKNPYSSDENLLHISFEGGLLEDPWNEPEEEMFKLSVSPENAPDVPTYIEMDFEQGDPVAINGERLGPVELFSKLNTLGGENGIGRLDMVENRFVGMKSRGVEYSKLIYNGFWFAPEMELLQKTMDESQKTVNGTVRLKLYKGNCIPVGRKSDNSLYSEAHATFEEDAVYDQADAGGFIRLNSLRLQIQALNRK
jgi:argininosuccinate synthase